MSVQVGERSIQLLDDKVVDRLVGRLTRGELARRVVECWRIVSQDAILNDVRASMS